MNEEKLPRVPLLIFTKNGREIGREQGPSDATDVHICWGTHPYAHSGFWTKHGQPTGGGRFPIPPETNDYHLAPDGNPREGVVLPDPPRGANDAEFEWDETRFTAGWWTRDGQRIERIPLPSHHETVWFKAPEGSE